MAWAQKAPKGLDATMLMGPPKLRRPFERQLYRHQGIQEAEDLPPEDHDDQVSFKDILRQISKANATRKGEGTLRLNCVADNDSIASNSTVLPEDTVYSKMNESVAEFTRELREALEAEQQAARPAKLSSLRVRQKKDTVWYNTWNWTSQPFTPDKEMWYLQPKQLNPWEEVRIMAPERTWPTGPCGNARPEFHDSKREGLPHWKPGAYGVGRGERCFADPPPLRKARASSARGPRPRAMARGETARPMSGRGAGRKT